MRRSCLIIILGVAILVAPSNLVAGGISVATYGGIPFPTGDFASTNVRPVPQDIAAGYGTAGFSLGALVEYNLTDYLAAGVRFGYNRFGIDTDILELFYPGPVMKGHYRIYEIGPFVALYPQIRLPIQPYLRGGTYYADSRASGTFNYGNIRGVKINLDFESLWGAEYTIGLLHHTSGSLGYFAEGSYNIMYSKGSKLSADVGIFDEIEKDFAFNASWLAIRAGIKVYLGK